MGPEPVGGVSPDGAFVGGVDLFHDFGDRAREAIDFGVDGFIDYDFPLTGGDAIAKDGANRAIIAEGKDGGCCGAEALNSHKGKPDTVITGMLVCQKTDCERLRDHRFFQRGAFPAAFEKEAVAFGAEGCQEAIAQLVIQAAIGCSKLEWPEMGRYFSIELEIAEVADQAYAGDSVIGEVVLREILRGGHFQVFFELFIGHLEGANGGKIGLNDAFIIFKGESENFIPG